MPRILLTAATLAALATLSGCGQTARAPDRPRPRAWHGSSFGSGGSMREAVARKRLERLLAHARFLYDAGQYEKCEAMCRRALRESPGNEGAEGLMRMAREARAARTSAKSARGALLPSENE